MKNILLHICCGPCAITTVEMLRDEGFNVTGFFYNPNIQPAQEYLRRREGLQKVAEQMDFPVIFWGQQEAYDPKEFYRAVTFKEHNRCLFCYKLRLQKTLEYTQKAASGAYQYISTSLLYSKYQNHAAIRAIGESLTKGMNAAKVAGGFQHFEEFQDSQTAQNSLSSSAASAYPQFYYADFRAGWGRGIKLSKKWEIYRQQYCGCVYSEMERYKQELGAC